MTVAEKVEHVRQQLDPILRTRVRRLEEALAPFARYADELQNKPNFCKDAVEVMANPWLREPTARDRFRPTVADLRRAREALRNGRGNE